MSTKLKKAIKEIEKTEKIIKENQDKLKVLNRERRKDARKKGSKAGKETGRKEEDLKGGR